MTSTVTSKRLVNNLSGECPTRNRNNLSETIRAALCSSTAQCAPFSGFSWLFLAFPASLWLSLPPLMPLVPLKPILISLPRLSLHRRVGRSSSGQAAATKLGQSLDHQKLIFQMNYKTGKAKYEPLNHISYYIFIYVFCINLHYILKD